jgi:hypothetical protein
MSLPDISSVNACIRFRDGRSCHVMLTPEGIQRWGADKQTLGDAVDATEAMLNALREADAFGFDAEAAERYSETLEA